MNHEELLAIEFPRLLRVERKSDPSTRYNCIAWAAGENNRWWWPTSLPGAKYYWPPPPVPRTVTIEAFLQAFSTIGFQQCDNGALEPGVEKIALYALDSLPKHAARQLPSGRWTSKMGNSIDIEHGLLALSGSSYGEIVAYMRRPRQEVVKPKKKGRRHR